MTNGEHYKKVSYRTYIEHTKRNNNNFILNPLGPDDYVIWDGCRLSAYLEPLQEDGIITNDMKLISRQRSRKLHISQGRKVIQFFSCKSDCSAYEIECNGYPQGLYTKCELDTIKSNPKITIRNLISATNTKLKSYDVEQQAEVVCPRFVLDTPMDEIFQLPGIVFDVADCCRTPYDEAFMKNNYRRFSLNRFDSELLWMLRDGFKVIRTPEGYDALVYPRKLVDTLSKKINIHVRIKEHAPPHFHVESPDINASFRIDNCEYINGNMAASDIKIVKYWYSNYKGRQKLIKTWNETRPADCPVGEIE